MNTTLSRRQAITAALAVGSALAITRSLDAAELPAYDVGRKLNADGTVHPFAGNTFIGHVEQQGFGFDSFDALLDIYREAPRHRFCRKLMLLPPSSYHVTVFGGLNEVDRGTQLWPASIPAGMPIAEVTQRWLEQLRSQPKINTAPFDFTPDAVERLTDGSPHIPLRPIDEATAVRLVGLREELSRFTGIRRADQDRYRYHLTFGYLRQRLTATEADELLQVTQGWTAALPARLRIPAFEFCSFRDMFAFRILHVL